MKRRISMPLALGALLVLLMVAAPVALAVDTGVRIETRDFTALPQTWVDEGTGGGTYSDSDGSEYTTSQATAFGATALATYREGVTWDFSVFGMGPFVNSFSGQMMDPATYADWWSFAVNGYGAPVGAANLQSVDGDHYLWFQNPDNTFSKPSTLLVLADHSGEDGWVALTRGQKLTFTVKGDDLAKVNSQADATRFGISDPSMIQTPSQFPLVSGATVYVGNKATRSGSTPRARVVSRGAARFDVRGLPKGTWYVWAEKPMDDTVYARAQALVVNVGTRPAVKAARTKPRRFQKNRALTIQYRLNKGPLRIRWTIKSKGRTIARGRQTHAGGGWQGFTWTGRTRKKLGRTLTVYLKAYDEWGRVSTSRKFRVRVR